MTAETMLKMCIGKHAYRTLRSAEAALKRRYKVSGVRLRVYACPICDMLHLTAKVPIAAPLPVPIVAVKAVDPVKKKRKGKMVTAVAEQMAMLAVKHPDLSKKKLKQMAVNRIRKMQAKIWRDYTTNGYTATGGAP
jgi:hypothetical protein